MTNEIRSLITNAYELLTHHPDFDLIKSAMIKLPALSDDFFRLNNELNRLKFDLRTEINTVSHLTEEIEGVVNEIKLLIERKKRNFKIEV